MIFDMEVGGILPPKGEYRDVVAETAAHLWCRVGVISESAVEQAMALHRDMAPAEEASADV